MTDGTERERCSDHVWPVLGEQWPEDGRIRCVRCPATRDARRHEELQRLMREFEEAGTAYQNALLSLEAAVGLAIQVRLSVTRALADRGYIPGELARAYYQAQSREDARLADVRRWQQARIEVGNELLSFMEQEVG